jgi:hypothetical protein
MGRKKKQPEATSEDEDQENDSSSTEFDLDDDNEDGFESGEDISENPAQFNKEARRKLEELLENKRTRKELEDFDDFSF